MGAPRVSRALKFGALSPTLISGPTNVTGFPLIVTAPRLSCAIASYLLKRCYQMVMGLDYIEDPLVSIGNILEINRLRGTRERKRRKKEEVEKFFKSSQYTIVVKLHIL